MEKARKYVLLNGGTETRTAFARGLGGAPFESYHTKHLMLHIGSDGEFAFLHRGVPADWTGARVFTRLRGTDQQFSGMLYDYFAHAGIYATDPINRSYVNSAEKISQMLTLTLHGIRVPESFIFREESYERNKDYIESRLRFPAVYKTDGSKGRDVHYVPDLSALHALLHAKKPHVLALVQPFIENTFDTRTIVAFGTILGTIKRARTKGYVNNIAQGAIASAYELTDTEKVIAVRAAHVCGIDIAGVDIIHTNDGPVVLEVNKSPQMKGFESVYGFKVLQRVAELMRGK